ncbi:MAG: tetratricopeptide repeat protein [Pyrinomonadaceae bacterium]|nr:tetratricopeptide repeat protein [Pyrinomonadaceae bacterium]
MSKRRFLIAFSFAGEKRDFVSQVAAILASRFGESAILYDKYHEAEFARRDLGIYLPELYHKQSELVVVVVCPDYDEKEWTGLEWTAIHDLLANRNDDEVMLCRFEHAEVAGLYSTAGFVELDHKTPEQAATLILERLALNQGKPKNHYTATAVTAIRPPSTSTPNNLPRLQPFFGRTEELKRVAEALDPESRTWGALIDGPGGMGKTSLAVRAAYDCPPGQFQRIIFLSVKDRELDDDGERQLGTFILPGFLEMLNELARELGQPEITKAPEDQRIKLLLAALGPAQALLILDNLESLTKSDRDQLFTFVKRLPQGCKAILTSRRRIGSSSDELILEKLDEDAALETLADLALHNPLLAKTNEAERMTLYEQTGGKPLLLRWVAGQLGRGSCRTFTDALHFIRSCPPNNDPLEFIFGDLAQEFTADETQVLVALTYFTLPAKVEHIATVAGLGEEPVETALRSLANRSLVVPDQEERAFALVPMVADFLRRKRPEVIAETGNRLEQRAYALIVENGYTNHDRFPMLDEAWPTVAAALPIFIDGLNPRFQIVCSALRCFFEFTGRWDEWLSLEQQAEAKAVAASDYENAGWRAFQAGWVHYLRQQPDAVLAYADRAAVHWNTARAGAHERSTSIRLRGVGHELNKDYPAAIAAYCEALELRRTLSPESEDVASMLNDLSAVENLSGDLAAAERDLKEALRVARAGGYAEGVATYTGNLAGRALDRLDWAGAEILAREALNLAENIGRQELIASDCGRLAKALVRQGKGSEALPYAQRAVEIYSRLGVPSDLEAARETLEECEA